MKDILDKALEDVDELGHLLMTKYKKNSKKIYIIVEGYDDEIYYTNFLQDYLPDDWDYEFIQPNKSTINCSSKKKILRCYANIDWRIYNKTQILFFVDRDLSDFIDEHLPTQSNFYITDGYSIENNIINENILPRVMTELCYFHGCSEEDKKYFKELYNNCFKFFYNTMANVMGWVIYWQLNGQNPQLGNIEMKKIFKFDIKEDCSLKDNIDNEYFHKKFKIPYNETVKTDKYVNDFKKFDKNKMLIRGKYLLEFFIEFCLFINSQYANIKCINITKRNNKATMPKLSFIDLAHIAKKPKSLAIFLENNINQYISKFNTI